MFFLAPLIFLGISYLFTQDSKGLTVLGSFIVIILFFAIVYTSYYCQYKGGKERCYDVIVARQERPTMMENLPEDMQYLKANIKELSEHTGLPNKEVPAIKTMRSLMTKTAKRLPKSWFRWFMLIFYNRNMKCLLLVAKL